MKSMQSQKLEAALNQGFNKELVFCQARAWVAPPSIRGHVNVVRGVPRQ